jgi:hypothetical protein
MTKKAKSKKSKRLQNASKPSRNEDFVQQLQAWISTKKGPIETAAYEEAKKRISNAWEKASEFETALHFTLVLKRMEPLASFLESETPLTPSDRLTLARFVSFFEAPTAGRPRGPLSGDVNAAQRNAVYWVRLHQQTWLKENKRQRVPTSVTNDFITDAINLASEAFKLRSKLSSDDIRALVNKTSRKIIS